MANGKVNMNRKYKIAEVKARFSHSREDTIEKISEYMERDFENDSHKDLVEEIVYLKTNGCQPLREYSDDELIEELIYQIDRCAEVHGEQEWERFDE